ncbi:hypothetical protein C8J56DRAFT_949335 [Mycena floridula]|nr:hypothetical protein C8J56DRAFT_949335 [Mycena floridula]
MLAIFTAVFFFLAGQALAFNITVGTTLLQANDILGFNFNVAPMTGCNDLCTTAKSNIAVCTEDTCFCRTDTVASLLTCEQCMYNALVAANKPMPDMRAGSNPVMAAYATYCTGITNPPLTKAQSALALAPNWDGPAGIFVPIGGLVVTVGTGAFLAVSAIVLVSTM